MRQDFITCPQCDGKPHRYYNEPKQRLISSKPKHPTFYDVTYRDAYCATCNGNGIIHKDKELQEKLTFTTRLLQPPCEIIVRPKPTLFEHGVN